MWMMRFQFTISHVPGKELSIADALSRAEVSSPSVADQNLQQETMSYVNFVLQNLPATEERLQEIKQTTFADRELSSANRAGQKRSLCQNN